MGAINSDVVLMLLLAATLLALPGPVAASPVQHHGQHPIPRVVVCATNASAPERAAAASLVSFLNAILGDAAAVPPVINATHATAGMPQLAVGYGAARLLGVPAASLTGLGREGHVLQPTGASLALSGGEGAPRGALYALNEFLEAVGVQFLTADGTLLPKGLPAVIPSLRLRYIPTLEYRQTFGFQFLTSQDFNVHMRTNRAHENNPAPMLDAAHGGVYPVFAAPLGSAHTSYILLDGINHGLGGPPAELFASKRG